MILALGGRSAGTGARPHGSNAVADATAVVVTYNGLPWIEQCLESLPGYETVLVDHGSTDGTRRRSSASGSPTCASSSRRTAASAPG